MNKLLLFLLCLISVFASAKTLTKMVILPPSTGYWIFSAANTGTVQLSLFCTYDDASTDTTCTGAGGTVTWFTENPNALTVNSSGLATGAGAPAWVSTTTYSSGQIVSSGGAIWTALQFTTNETPGSGGSWLRAVGTSIGAYNGAISGHAGVAVSPTALTCINIRPETTASSITLGSTILLSVEDCSSGDNVGGAAIGNYPAWTSSNTGVATVNNIGEVTATGVGSASITATFVGISQSRTVAVSNPTILGTTWFVRADGGTVKDTNVPGGQCDGTLNVALSGSSGGHCAVNEIMYCFTDETSSSVYTGIVQGGDTCQVAAPPAGTFYHVAQKSPGTAWVTAALAPGAIAPPSGKPGSPTKLIGAGFATCESADPLHLGSCIPTVSYGAVTLELYDVQNFDVKGIDLWSGVDCIRSASPLFFNCPSGAGAREAIFVDQFTNNFTIENSRIHGYFASIAGTPGPGTVWTNVAVLYNTLTGINFDNPFGYNGNRSDGFSLVNSYIGYAGFAEELVKPLTGGSVTRGSGNLNVTFPSGSIVNYVPGTNLVLAGMTPSDLNGTYPVTSVNFNQQTLNITGGSLRSCNDGFNSVGCADFTTSTAPAFIIGPNGNSFVTIAGVTPSFLNGTYEILSVNGTTGFTVAASLYTRPGWGVSGTISSGGTASTALSLVATAAGSSESASVLGTASHVSLAHHGMDQADDTHFSNGDCVGTGNNTIGVWISTGNQFHRCSQDGWDMLHSAMTSSIFTGNYVEGVEGQALKLGDADSAVVKNNIIVSTAGANLTSDGNLPPDYNQYLTTFFRAGDAFLTHNEAFDSMIFTNNTVLNVGQNVTWDDQCDSVIGCQSLPFAVFVFQNNDVIAASDTNNPVFNSSQPTIYFQGQNAPIFTTPAWNPNNNLAFQGRNPPGGIGTGNNWALGACPTIACVANITTFAGESASLQGNWNMNVLPATAPIGAGINNSFTPAVDFNGTVTTVPSVVGAVNPLSTPTPVFSGRSIFTGTVKTTHQ